MAPFMRTCSDDSIVREQDRLLLERLFYGR